MELQSRHGIVKVFAKTIEKEAIGQIIEMANSRLGENAHIRIMPDAHAGKGCVIGTTMHITDKVQPNIVGVDIGCGVDYVETDIDFNDRLQELELLIRETIPFGKNVHDEQRKWKFEELRCWENLPKSVMETALHSLGTLGGGNHFIEAYGNGGISVHSGSRNIGYRVAQYYQDIADKGRKEEIRRIRRIEMEKIEPKERSEWIKEQVDQCGEKDSCLQGENMDNYIHDVKIMQQFARENRKAMLDIIVEGMKGNVHKSISSVHNYIDIKNMILRKGAISAQKEELLVIPLNMRDGLLICKGKGNEDWNFSAPHGAGRLYSRTKAKQKFTVDEYIDAMKGIYSTCISKDTLDEAPFAYKDYREIVQVIEPTVEIITRLEPIYNFKAN